MADLIVGADEAGTGAWCGPLTACAVIAPRGWGLPGLNDSKQLTFKARWELRERLLADPDIRFYLGWRTSTEIDASRLGKALKAAYAEILGDALAEAPDAEVIVDGTIRVPGIVHRSEPKADAKYPAVMAASILAKTSRDHWMIYEAHRRFPVYGWDSNMGYHAHDHVAGLDIHGPCELHRFSYAPIRKYAELFSGRHDEPFGGIVHPHLTENAVDAPEDRVQVPRTVGPSLQLELYGDDLGGLGRH